MRPKKVKTFKGIRKQGKGSFYRIKTSDEQYIKNYNKIDWTK
jgi:hypothetical protein